MNEVIVFTNGDSSKLSTWSNVPYCFTDTLIRKGVRVHRVDINPHPRMRRWFNRHVMRFVRRIAPHTTYDYFRSWIHYLDVKRRIRRAIVAHPNADHHIFLTFSFSSAGMSKATCLHFGDWTYDHHIRYFKDRKPDFFERRSIAREDACIQQADLIFPLFPRVEKYMIDRYKHPETHYLGNVINAVVGPEDEADIIHQRMSARRILFIGKDRYVEGARQLIEAFKLLKPVMPDLRLDIVGMTDRYFGALPEGVFCHGYLDKGHPEERALYYDLMRQARVFVNTTPRWGAFSATVEAMYMYLPVVVTPYGEFTETFSRSIDFGCYCPENRSDLIAAAVSQVFKSEDYPDMCRQAHVAVESYSWDSYIEQLMSSVEAYHRSKKSLAEDPLSPTAGKDILPIPRSMSVTHRARFLSGLEETETELSRQSNHDQSNDLLAAS
jgi:glycosyltransferase involved in cell wall biosynthesis